MRATERKKIQASITNEIALKIAAASYGTSIAILEYFSMKGDVPQTLKIPYASEKPTSKYNWFSSWKTTSTGITNYKKEPETPSFTTADKKMICTTQEEKNKV